MSQALKLYVVLSRAYRAILAHDERDVRRHGLNLTEFAILELLYHKGPHPLQQIGKKILITSGSITYVVDKLEKKGLLYRRPCEKDRRVIYAVLSDAGKSLIEAIFPEHVQALMYAMGGLSPAEQEMAILLLKKLGREAENRLLTSGGY
ncbi:MarR family winged helix-turn-helix transcriptional regulator [Sporolituus thermophilus]|uniref:MarR family transcriptional regulator, 2-MHQ and catechol-resistance regulon repressor n=1 Tax=Sporolituus thermophilus DSM 23256 TaxID=1123285 RepID=A0A1G7IND5_9FIRM|nr:MarR family transcriptional regulator [Sporolituus thermophilus]SDF14054.1 MarR family transcriptional regulator, 2-MHQ and catechol-resistance regulon repressor [Sporolituus thermophilus DSM 23256]